jgi:UDP-N-acetylmuramoylalanine-D-glutamate ligase
MIITYILVSSIIATGAFAVGLAQRQERRRLVTMVQYCKKVILFGRDAAVLHACLGAHIPCVQVHSLHEAVVVAGESAEQGDGVLLSPACASTDMFRNYEDRGEQFVMEARKLGFD